MSTRNTDRCVVCDGHIRKETFDVPNRPPELMVYGPGGKNNYREEQTLYCDSCGICYRKLPSDTAKIKIPVRQKLVEIADKARKYLNLPQDRPTTEQRFRKKR